MKKSLNHKWSDVPQNCLAFLINFMLSWGIPDCKIAGWKLEAFRLYRNDGEGSKNYVNKIQYLTTFLFQLLDKRIILNKATQEREVRGGWLCNAEMQWRSRRLLIPLLPHILYSTPGGSEKRGFVDIFCLISTYYFFQQKKRNPLWLVVLFCFVLRIYLNLIIISNELLNWIQIKSTVKCAPRIFFKLYCFRGQV